MKIATANFRTTCPTCGHQIQPTNRIVTAAGSTARHDSCVRLSEWEGDARREFAGVAADILSDFNRAAL